MGIIIYHTPLPTEEGIFLYFFNFHRKIVSYSGKINNVKEQKEGIV